MATNVHLSARLLSVQPMNLPTGQIFYIDPVYKPFRGFDYRKLIDQLLPLFPLSTFKLTVNGLDTTLACHGDIIRLYIDEGNVSLSWTQNYDESYSDCICDYLISGEQECLNSLISVFFNKK